MNIRLAPKPVLRALRSRITSVGRALSRYGSSLLSFAKTRTFALSLYVCASMILIASIVLNTKIVQVNDGGKSKYVYTFRSDPASILKQEGITLTAKDEYDITEFKHNRAKLDLYVAFPVMITADGTTRKVTVTRGTVADVLAEAGLTLGPDDLINLPLNLTASPDMDIVINRVTYKTVIQKSPIPYQTETIKTTLLKKGAQRVLVEGQNGETDTTVKQKFIDGVLESEQVVGTCVAVKPVNSRVLVGTAANTPVSDLEPPSGFVLDENGRPSKYKKVFDAVATAYTPRDGTYTATGRKARVGYIAVDPRKIPYGTKLYIMSADGSFVYGYAIAYDTGRFAYSNSGIDLDLFFGSLSQAKEFGRRQVRVYVLS